MGLNAYIGSIEMRVQRRPEVTFFFDDIVPAYPHIESTSVLSDSAMLLN